MILISILIFILGAIIGSFINVVVLRHSTGRGLDGRSFCFLCRHKLSFFDLIPIFSFLFLGGKCKYCNSRISWQYLLVEILAGGIFLLIFNFQFSIFNDFLNPVFIINTLIYWVIFSLLLAISVYDFHHKIIPNTFVYPFIILVFLSNFIFPFENLKLKIVNLILSGLIVALPIFLVWFFSRGRGMGFGDVKLALGIGFLFSLYGALSALILSFFIGLIVSIFLLLFKRGKFTIKSEIPFGPFLAIACFVVFFFNLDLFSFFSLFIQ